MIDHGQADAEEDHQRLGDVADAEPEHDDRHQRRLRHGVDHHQERVEERRDAARTAHHQSERDRKEHADAEADRHAAQRGQDVDQQFLVAKDGGDRAHRFHAVGKLSVFRISAPTCQTPSSPRQASHGAARRRSVRPDIMAATPLRRRRRTCARYRPHISDSGDRAAVPSDGAAAADRCR